MTIPEPLLKIISQFPKAEYPCLNAQLDEFSQSKPLKGFRVLHCTSLFQNTLVKVLPLIASGADLVFSLTRSELSDPVAVKALRDCGYNVYLSPQDEAVMGVVDVVLDCNGSYAHLHPQLGSVELTKSGEFDYQKKPYPVISVDRSPVKKLEDTYGTAEAFMRALEQSNISVLGRRFVVFGYGKVGQGVVHQLIKAGADVCVVELENHLPDSNVVESCRFEDHALVLSLILKADVVVTCTGAENIFQAHYAAHDILKSKAVFINLGARDEFGPDIPVSRVQNQKKSFNFILKDPTRLIYIDPVFALHNVSALTLINKKLPPGIHAPDENLEQAILSQTSGFGCLN